MKKEKLHFVLVAPKNMRGGTIVIHELCRELNRQGCNAKVFYICDGIYKNPSQYWSRWFKYTFIDEKGELFRKRRNDSLSGCRRKFLPFVRKNTIVIYPDIVYGNILRAKHVVRWLLSYNRYTNDSGAYGKNDLFYCYRLQFNDYELNPMKRKLCVCYYNFDIYRRINYGERKGKCYVLHKGKNRTDLPDEFDGVIVDDLSELEKVRIFNLCEYCIYIRERDRIFSCVLLIFCPMK